MDTWQLVGLGIAIGLALLSFCNTVWLLIREPSSESITLLAQELKRSRKAEAMREVREAAAAAREASAPVGTDGKPLPFGNVEAVPTMTPKEQLRHRFYGTPRRGNGS